MKLMKLSFFVLIVAALFMSCQKEYSLENSHAIIPAGTWQFNDSTKLYSGNMDTAYIQTTGSTKILHLEGTSLTNGQVFHMQLYADSILKTGTYRASAGDVDFLYFTPATSIYQVDQLRGEFIVNITVLSNNTVTGTFSGLADDSLLNTKTLTLGQFTSRVDLSSNVIGGGSGVATGTLGNTAGNCVPASFAGTFTQGVALTAANTAQVTVTVATLGTYTISTNTVNGVSFSKSGTFTSAGSQLVTLDGTGTPTAAGAQTFTVTFGASTCSFAITFAAAGPPAVGTLGGSPGTCTTATPAGTFTQGVPLSSANTITVSVNVTTIGSYSITTNTVNGVTFSGSGAFTVTGPQNVILTGSGTPTNSGTQNFTVTFLTSTCNFSLAFAAAVTDYFPLTTNSNWTYIITSGLGTDSVLYKVISYAPTFSTHVYNTITTQNIPSTGANDSAYFRKPGGDYYQYGDVSGYFGFDNPVFGEFIFLKDNVPANTTWQSPNFAGTTAGFPFTGFIVMTLVSNSTVTIGSNTFPNTIKVKYDFYYSIAPGTPIATGNQWFAKGVGLIHQDDGGTTAIDISHYQVF